MQPDFEKQMCQVFLEEALESLSTWETACLNFEKTDQDEAFNQLFRIAHNLKGSSLSVGLQQFGNFIHKVEELMTALKNKTCPYEPDILNLFFEVHSIALDWIQNLQKNDKFEHTGNALLLKKVVYFLEKSKNGAPAEKKEPTANLGFGFFDDEPVIEIKKEEPSVDLSKVTEQQSKVTENSSVKISDDNKEKENKDNKETKENKDNKSSKKQIIEEYLRVNVYKLDQLINFIGEIVVDQNIMKQKALVENIPQDVKNVISQMSKNIQELQNIAMSLRMMPLDQQFQKMHRIVRDLSVRQNKEIKFESFGADVELDKIIVEKLTDPLTHLIRNAVDHGIEECEERAKTNKPKVSHIELHAMQVEDRVKIYLKDDGRGLDENKILKNAISKGIVAKNAVLTSSEIHRLIFQPGFSTKEIVSDISGRGVGLDVVNKVIDELKGLIEIETQLGKGTTFTITLPSSLSIIKGIIVKSSEQLFVLPESQLCEIVDHNKVTIEQRSNGSQAFALRKEIIPIISLSQILGIKKIESKLQERNGLIIQYLGGKISFEVDEIISTQSIVLKKLSHELHGLPGVVATTVLGSGEPALVLNLSQLINIWGVHGTA